MENLHEFPQSLALNTPSLRFWLKAGFGFGSGFFIAAAAAWFVYAVVAVGFVLGLLRSFAAH